MILLPCLFDIRWAKNLNETLSTIFKQPLPIKYGAYYVNRTYQHILLAHFLKYIREHKENEVFIANLFADYSQDIMRMNTVRGIAGIIHGTSMDQYEPSGNWETPLMEEAIAEGTTRVLTTSKLLKDKLPFKDRVEAVGLPNPFGPSEPIINDKILFNHRVTREKCPEKIQELPEAVRKRVIITSPVEYEGPEWWKKRLGPYQINYDDASYERLLRSCGFGISFAYHDTWGVSAIEGILSGALYLMPNDPRTAYPEIHIPELLYNDMDDMLAKLEYYGDDSNTDERIDVVKKAQENLAQYAPETWLGNVLKKLEYPPAPVK